MTSIDIAMLIGGIVVLVAAIGLVIYCVLKNKPYKPLLVLFFIAIVMIGFPNIKKIVFPGGGEIDTQSVTVAAANYQNNPENPNAITSFKNELRNIDNAQAAGKPLPPEVRSNLNSTVQRLGRANLSPESQVAYSHTLLVLGQTAEARGKLLSAIKAQPTLTNSLSPRMLTLLKEVPK
jgi:hypothetical protein